MSFKKLFSGSKSREPSPYAGPNHGATSPLSSKFRPNSSSPPTGQPWQAPTVQNQPLNTMQSPPYLSPHLAYPWQAPVAQGRSVSPAPSNHYSPPPPYQQYPIIQASNAVTSPAQSYVNTVAYAPYPPSATSSAVVTQQGPTSTPAENQVSTLFTFLSRSHAQRTQVALRPEAALSRLPLPPPLPPRMPSSPRPELAAAQVSYAQPSVSRNPSPFTKGPVKNTVPRRLPGKVEPPKIRKILSLDGGGVRGLSIIMILKYIMKNLNRERGTHLHPWQEFDMIGGTSTGGIIAIMLGRLQMSLDECEEAYKTLSKKIFSATAHGSVNPRRMYDFLKANGKFDERPLEESIRMTLLGRNLGENELLQDRDPNACKVFVCATRAENSLPAVLRSYESRRNDPFYDICQIWEAVRATSAASTFFEPIQIGPNGETFVDGEWTKSAEDPILTSLVFSNPLPTSRCFQTEQSNPRF